MRNRDEENSFVPIVERAPGWDSLGGVWNSLVERSRSATPFLTREWLSRWWEAYGGGRELLLLAARPQAGDAVAAIAPLMLVREGGVRTIKFIGAGLSDSLDFIVPARRRRVCPGLLRFPREPRSSPLGLDLARRHDRLRRRRHPLHRRRRLPPPA